MPRSSRDEAGGDDGASRKRYSATVEKGENAWKREWSSFMSGVSLKRLRDGTSGVALKASADIERQVESAGFGRDEGQASSSASSAMHANAAATGREVGVNSDGIPLDARAGGASFSYLFSSPAERRAERETRERAEKERRRVERREQMAKADPLSVLSKHQRALYDAGRRGLQMEGMNRKARRDFLHLTVTEAQKKAEEQSREFKLHDLMDEKLAWYQQGPHPVDLIAEKLVRRKAEKKAKQLGLKYNYLAPHASWLAKRAQRRRESLLVGLGKRLVFHEDYDDADGGEEITVTDPLRRYTVPLREMGLLMTPTTVTPTAAAEDEDGVEAAVESAMKESSDPDEAVEGAAVDETAEAEADVKKEVDEEDPSPAPHRVHSVVPARLPDVGVLQDPARLATSFVRSVVRDRATAVAIQQMNRTTNFLSSDLVKGPSILPEDAAAAKGLPTQAFGDAQAFLKSVAMAREKEAAAVPKRPTRASAAPSFSPYASAEPVREERAAVPRASPRSSVTSAAPEKRKRVVRAVTDEDAEVGDKVATKKPKVAKSTSAKKKLSSSLEASAGKDKVLKKENAKKVKKESEEER